MNFEILADSLVERYKNEEVIEEAVIAAIPFLAIIAAGSAWTVALDWYIKNYNNGELPWWLTPEGTGTNEYLWMGLSLFDFTGQMSQVYYQDALKERERNPDDPWNNILVWLTFMGTLPLTNLSPIGLIKFVSGYSTVKRAITWIFRSGVGPRLKQAGVIDKGIPAAIAKMSDEGKGKEAILLRESTEKALGVKISDESIEAAAKRHNLEIKTPGLIKAPVKGAGVAAKTKKTLETTGKVARPVSKVGGIAGKLAGAGAMLGGMAGRSGDTGAKFGAIPVQYGWEGGRVGP